MNSDQILSAIIRQVARLSDEARVPYNDSFWDAAKVFDINLFQDEGKVEQPSAPAEGDVSAVAADPSTTDGSGSSAQDSPPESGGGSPEPDNETGGEDGDADPVEA